MTKAVADGYGANYHEACAPKSGDGEHDLVEVADDEICAGCGLSLGIAAHDEATDDLEEADDAVEDDDDDDDDDTTVVDPEEAP